MRETIAKLFPNISEEKIDKLFLFYKLILSYNSHTNITRITNDKEYIYKHIFDSVWPIINNEENFKGKKILDVGSGGGFPGIPIMIMFPGIKVDFIDFNIKKIRFLRLALKELGLDSNIYYQNVIDFGISSPKSYDIIITRAFKNLIFFMLKSIKSIFILGNIIIIGIPGNPLIKLLQDNYRSKTIFFR